MKALVAPLMLAFAFIGGCASVGTEFDISAVDSLVPGETTYQEAVNILGGPPAGSQTNDAGETAYRWLWSRSKGFGATADRVDLLFDSEGVFVRELARVTI